MTWWVMPLVLWTNQHNVNCFCGACGNTAGIAVQPFLVWRP